MPSGAYNQLAKLLLFVVLSTNNLKKNAPVNKKVDLRQFLVCIKSWVYMVLQQLLFLGRRKKLPHLCIVN
jgi:hypothetical protein